jgi:chromosome segregation ATPase
VEVEYALSKLTDDQLAVFVKERSVNPQVEQALRPILAKKGEVAGIAGEISARNTEVARIGQDQQRVRENMKALKGTAEEKALVQRYARQLDEQETRLEVLRKEIADLEQQRLKAQAELEKLVDGLTL